MTTAQEAWSEVLSLRNEAEDLIDYPGDYFPARSRARAAEAAYREAYPEAAAARDAVAKAFDDEEKDRRAADYRASFIARGLD